MFSSMKLVEVTHDVTTVLHINPDEIPNLKDGNPVTLIQQPESRISMRLCFDASMPLGKCGISGKILHLMKDDSVKLHIPKEEEEIIALSTAEFTVENINELNEALGFLHVPGAISRKLRKIVLHHQSTVIVRVLTHVLVLKFCGDTTGFVDHNTNISLKLKATKQAESCISSQLPLHVGLETTIRSLGSIIDNKISFNAAAPCACLVVGPHGCGKTMLLNDISTALQHHNIRIFNCGRLVLESEGRDLTMPIFSSNSLEVVLIDSIEVLASPTNSTDSSENRFAESGDTKIINESIAKALTWVYGVIEKARAVNNVLILGFCAEESFKHLPSKLVKRTSTCGFPYVTEIYAATLQERQRILFEFLTHFKVEIHLHETTMVAESLSNFTAGYVGSDLKRVCRNLLVHSKLLKRRLTIDEAIEHAKGTRQAASLDVAGNVSLPSEEWDWDSTIGGYSHVKRRLDQLVRWQWLYPDATKRLGVDGACGILLHGPSGCGKTLIANTLLRQARCHTVTVKASELLSQYFGESERLIRLLFTRARKAAPCIIFIDELDAIATRRDLEGSGNAFETRLLAAFLNEMDGIAASQGVLVLAATNRYDSIDSALLRPGRLGASILIDTPDEMTRFQILGVCTRGMPLDPKVNLKCLAEDRYTGTFSCAMLKSLCMEAGMNSARRIIATNSSVQIQWDDFMSYFKNDI